MSEDRTVYSFNNGVNQAVYLAGEASLLSADDANQMVQAGVILAVVCLGVIF